MLVDTIKDEIMNKEAGDKPYVFIVTNNTGEQEKLVICTLYKHKNGFDLFIDYEGIYHIASNELLEVCEHMESNGWQFYKGIDHEELYCEA